MEIGNCIIRSGYMSLKCNCGTRWMYHHSGDTYFVENDRLVENLVNFVNSCDCMDSKTKKTKK
mgnify:FL=1